jgi:hypothetical protein
MPVIGNPPYKQFLHKQSNRSAFKLFVLVLIVSYATLAGILFNNSLLKIIGSFSQIYALIFAFSIIRKRKKNLKKNYLIPLGIFFLYPLMRITIDVIHNPTFKVITDGFIIYSGYYQLCLSGLALALLSINLDFLYLLKKYLLVFSIPALLLIVNFLTLNNENQEVILFGHNIITNFLIPFSVFSLISLNKSSYLSLVSWISLALILFVASTISSRSYTIVGVLFLIFSFSANVKQSNYKLIISLVLLFLIALNLDLFSFFEKETLVQNKSISEKFAFESLFNRLEIFTNTLDFKALFYWEGNSRAGILEDAFGSFNFEDILFGKGIFGTYESFVTRSTIEMGWATEAFRWGVVYLFIALIYLFFGYKKLRKNSSTNPFLYKVLITVMTVKVIDGFIYGMPTVSIYNLIFFWAIMQSVVRNKVIK